MNDPQIRLSGIGMSRDHRQILKDIDLTVGKGDFLAITGPNGGGKTTLLRIILRLLRPTSGTVEYLDAGHPVKTLPIGYLPQKNMIDSRFPVTVREVVASGLLKTPRMPRVEKSRLVDDMLRRVELWEQAGNGIGALSGGQLQRALLGRALISSPGVLVLDEPLSYLDKHFEHRVYEILSDYAGRATIILVSHEMSIFAAMANRHIVIDRSLRECHAGSHLIHCDCEY